jgi:putative sterol carrier protein
VKYLSQEWLDRARSSTDGQPAGTSEAARVQHVISGGPDGDVKYVVTHGDGRVQEATLGTVAEPDVTVTAPYPVWAGIARGEQEMSVAYMQGVVKVAGDTGKWLELLAADRAPEGRARRDALRDVTEFPA